MNLRVVKSLNSGIAVLEGRHGSLYAEVGSAVWMAGPGVPLLGIAKYLNRLGWAAIGRDGRTFTKGNVKVDVMDASRPATNDPAADCQYDANVVVALPSCASSLQFFAQLAKASGGKPTVVAPIGRVTEPAEEVDIGRGTYAFKKGKVYLHIASGAEQGAFNVKDDKLRASKAAANGYSAFYLNVDERRKSETIAEFFKRSFDEFFRGNSCDHRFGAIVWSQHGGLLGAEDGALLEAFKVNIAPGVAPYLKPGGDVVLCQCYGVFTAADLQSIKTAFGGALIYYARGENSWQEPGVVSNMPTYRFDGTLITNRYTPWYSY